MPTAKPRSWENQQRYPTTTREAPGSVFQHPEAVHERSPPANNNTRRTGHSPANGNPLADFAPPHSKYPNNNSTTSALPLAFTNLPERTAADTPRPLQSTHTPVKATDAHADTARTALTEEERLCDPEYRKKIQHTKRVGHALALIIAAIDGVVTAMAVASVPFLAAGGVPVVVLIGLAGFMVNRIVYWRSVPDMLKQFFVIGFFKGLSTSKKVLIALSLIFATTLGASFAALAFKSLCMIFGLSMATAFAVNPALAIFITLLAMCYFVANTSLFFYTLSNSIRRDLHKRAWAFIKKRFTPDKSKHPIEQVLTTTFQVLFIVSGFALGVVAAYAILGKLAVSLTELLVSTANIPKDTAAVAAKVVVFGIAAIARFAFSIESCVGAFSKIGKALASLLYNTGWVIGHWSTAKPRLIQGWTLWKNNQKQALKGRDWDTSWQRWNRKHQAIFQEGTVSERVKCYTLGFQYAFKNLNVIRKLSWFVGGVWFAIHIPAIVTNAMGVLALGAGGGPHVHNISQLFGINISLEAATWEAMIAAGGFSGSLGMYKYMDLNLNSNDGRKKPRRAPARQAPTTLQPQATDTPSTPRPNHAPYAAPSHTPNGQRRSAAYFPTLDWRSEHFTHSLFATPAANPATTKLRRTPPSNTPSMRPVWVGGNG